MQAPGGSGNIVAICGSRGVSPSFYGKAYASTHEPDVSADPSNWGFPSSVVQTFGNDFLEDRALAAQAVGKPWVLEETGCNVGPAIVLRLPPLDYHH